MTWAFSLVYNILVNLRLKPCISVKFGWNPTNLAVYPELFGAFCCCSELHLWLRPVSAYWNWYRRTKTERSLKGDRKEIDLSCYALKHGSSYLSTAQFQGKHLSLKLARWGHLSMWVHHKTNILCACHHNLMHVFALVHISVHTCIMSSAGSATDNHKTELSGGHTYFTWSFPEEHGSILKSPYTIIYL